MKLDRVIIQNFRSIADATIHFAPPCRVLVGLNESGKSNILKALALLEGGCEPNIANDPREPLGDMEINSRNCFVRFVFRLNKEECAGIQKTVTSSILASAKNPGIVYFDGEEKNIGGLCSLYDEGLYDVFVSQQGKICRYWNILPRIKLLPGWKAVAENCPGDLTVEVGGQSVEVANYRIVRTKDFPNIPADALTDAGGDCVVSMIGKEITKIVEENLPNVLFWQYTEKNILPSSVRIDEFAANPDSYIPLKNMFALADCHDIGASIEKHRAGGPNKFRSFLDRVACKTTEHFRNAWKEYKSVKFTLADRGDSIVPGVSEKGEVANTYDFAKRSEGFKRFVTFLLMVSANVETGGIRDTLLLIDEPEASLHPSGARALRDLLIRISDKNTVVYSTHSIFMIDPDNIGRHCIVEKSKEQTSVNDDAQGGDIVDEEVLYNALGASMFQILKPKNLIFEGWRDKRLFQVALKKAGAQVQKQYENIGYCHARGATGVRAITPLIELAGRRYIVISDSDDPAIESEKEHRQQRGDGQWFTYQDIDPAIQAVTGEDFILNDHIIKQANSTLSGAGVPKITDANLDLPPKTGKLNAIRHWLISNRVVPKTEAKVKIEKIKDAIFDGLKPSHIDMPEYDKMLRGIILLVNKEQE